jgi:hypothetical protein
MVDVYCGAKIRSGAATDWTGTLGCFLQGTFFDSGRTDIALLTNKHVCNWKRIAANWDKLKKEDRPFTREERVTKMRESLVQRSAPDLFKYFETIYTLPENKIIATQPLCAFDDLDPPPDEKMGKTSNFANDFAFAILNTGVTHHNGGVIEATQPTPKRVPLTDLIDPAECFQRGLVVCKIGAVTGLTKGKVSGNANNRFVVRSVEGKPFSQSGDSGSVVYTEDGQVLGQLFMEAGQQESRCTTMSYIFQQLKAQFFVPGEITLAPSNL